MRRKLERLLLVGMLASAAALALPGASYAVVVLKVGSTQSVIGHLVRQSDQAIVVREELAGGGTREVTIPRSDVDELIITVSPERLAELDPSKPELYFEYAEELAEKRRDPEARDAARRLLAIAAHRGAGALRQRALVSLAALAHTSDEARRLKALAYLADAEHDEALLARSGTPFQGVARSGKAAVELVAALRFIRQGKAAEAKAVVERADVQKVVAEGGLPFTGAELAEWLTKPALTRGQLGRLVQAELALDPAQAEARKTNSSEWSDAGPAAVPTLKLERLTEFDPAECVFRNGRWGTP